MTENWVTAGRLTPIEKDRYWLVLTPHRLTGPGSFRVSLGEKRPWWLHRVMLRLLLGWRIVE